VNSLFAFGAGITIGSILNQSTYGASVAPLGALIWQSSINSSISFTSTSPTHDCRVRHAARLR
jgi:hypothetical protein